MRFVWFFWLARHVDEFGYSQGPLRAVIGTAAVLLTALLLGYALRRRRTAAIAAACLTGAAGVGWLALH
ncbi:hypothetical protein [Streptomyces kebangsaanensis]|uniref:hypothetical protein n=1 Tax=Streptomyces kebangsaanensis TaxID=864058 RepID=UPI00093D9B6E|nr:hypothetical protein [Streptomyces kebangsaanensis]